MIGPHCTISYEHRFVQDPTAVFERLVEELPLRLHKVVIQGREVIQPRLVCWHGPGRYVYSGLDLEPQEWPEDLLLLRRQLRKHTKLDFNSVLCNYYRDENDSVGWHADDETYFGDDPTIATISLGAARVFSMKPKVGRYKPDKYVLANGSLFIMGAGVQQHWYHSIQKSTIPIAPRLSLTYRIYTEPKT